MPELKGQNALITGGASGIGKALAEALARSGVNTAIADLNPDVESIAAEMAQNTGGQVMGLRMDVTKPDDVKAGIDSVAQRLGGLHILGNIAGIYKRDMVADMTPEQWDLTMDINLRGPFVCTHFALPIMIAQQYGRIVNIVSGLAVIGAARSSAYAASKAGLMAFTKSAAAEVYNDGININCLAPGITDTPLMRGANRPEEIEQTLARSPRPLGKPEDVVGAFLFLISDAAKLMSGITLWMRNP